MAFAELWLPIIGAGICIAWAIGAWYGGNKVLSIWLVFCGAVCLLLLGTLQWQHALHKEEPHREEPSDATQKQLRAYVNVTKSEVRNFGVGQASQIHIVFKNGGLTPAYDVRGWDGTSLDASPPTKPFVIDPIIDTIVTGSTVGPGGEWHIVRNLSTPLTLEHIEVLASGKTAIYAWGTLRYRDAFGHQRITNFRVFYGGDYGLRETGAMAHMREGNDSD